MIQNITYFLLNHTPLLYWTQSLWRDEAFSVWIARDGLIETINRTSGDFNPPLYYLLLNLWMKVFGSSEVALRGLSVMAFLFFLFVIFRFSLALFQNRKAAYFTTILMAANPMLVYFAFELRMYSLVVLLAALSMYMLYIKNWTWYIVTSTLGIYTQPFMVILIIAQNVYLTLTGRIRSALRNDLLIGLLYLPWLPTLITQFKNSGPMWIYPVDLNLVTSVLGNLYVGYEGTPGNLWFLMQILSMFTLAIALFLWKAKSTRQQTLLFLTWIIVPLTIVLGVSFFKPIYVNRYVIYVTVAEVFLLAHFALSISAKRVRLALAGILLFSTFSVNFIAVSFHRKVPIRNAFKEINALLRDEDVVYAETPLIFYESLYYTRGHKVYLYNPNRITPPRYVGSGGMPETIWATSAPPFPKRAFMVRENGEFYLLSILTKN